MRTTIDTTHRLHKDVAALPTGTLLVALGITLFAQAQLVSGGTAGLALLVHHVTDLPFGALFFALNLPFYALSLARMGVGLTLRTVAAVALVSALAGLTGSWIAIAHLDPVYAAVADGALIGVGLLILFRHRASLGGFNILALHLQERHGLRAGYVQLGLDTLVLAGALWVLPPDRAALSLAGAAVLNLVIATNHKPGRYVGAS